MTELSEGMELVTSFRFVFIASRPFGIFPYKLKKLTNSHVLIIPDSIIRQCKIVFVLFGVLKAVILLAETILYTTADNRFAVAFRSVNNIILYTLMALAYRSIFAHSISICDWLNKISKNLSSMNASCHRLHSSNNFVVLYSLAFYLAANVTSIFYLWTNAKFIGNWLAAADSLIFVVALAAENLFICQFIIFVDVARLFFARINDEFEEESSKRQPGTVSVTKLQELRILHSSATDFYDCLQIAFELNLLFYITWAFFSILCCVVSVVLFDWNDALTLIIWSTYHPCQIIPLLYVCDSVSKEAKRAAHHLENLLSECLSPCIKKEVELFSLQLQHRPTNFNVCGFFDLDFALLHSMVASITTYTIALLQVPSPSYPLVEDNRRNVNSSFA